MHTPRPEPYPAGHLEEIISYFGDARLMRDLEGKYTLVGGSEADRKDAREWIQKFLKDIKVKF